MSTSGRRAWRKWLRSQRKHDDLSWAADIGTCRGRAAFARRHRGSNAGQGIPLDLPRSVGVPFTARSLVGMTMGARKRIAGDIAFSKAVADYRSGNITEVFPGQIGEYERAEYKSYRVGQKLRPCPGCLWCRSCIGCEVLDFEGDTCRRCGRDAPVVDITCDGSGVMPARKAKRVLIASLPKETPCP